jgi:RimJ/RimL family protein N-acetyltransferase
MTYTVVWTENDGAPIGGFAVEGYTGKGGSCYIHFAGNLGWITRQRIRSWAEYVFDHLECSIVYGMVVADDKDVIAIDKRIGWSEIMVMPNFFSGGKDGLLLSMRREECKWIPSKLRLAATG